MGKRCVIGGYSNTNRDGVSVHKFPKGEALRENGTVLCDTPAEERLAAACYVALFQKALVLRKLY